ncbi:hypothetical protein [Castellaniella sp. S9]|uniref:hypothetical protein n=1 Tax=Castellaniella sp. S9 TaxID=2993652 RepID=UPI0022B2DC3B|nr:hypothetical protein [Castellaniella sp. S9]
MTINTQKLALQALAGHGHVKPRPDGVRARCGGPAICRVCQQEKAQLEMSQRMDQALHPLDGQHINQGSVDAAAEAYERDFLQAKIDAQSAEIARLRNMAWTNGDILKESQAETVKLRAELAHLRAVLSQALMALEGYLPSHRNDVTDRAIAVARAALSGESNG